MVTLEELETTGVLTSGREDRSKEIDELAKALSQAQGEFVNPKRDKHNAFKRYNYADLSSFLTACLPILSKHQLAITQPPISSDGVFIRIRTILLHGSGQWISGELALCMAKLDAQSAGSAISYLRKYSLQSLLGLAQKDSTDDDGQGAMPGAAGAPGVSPTSPAPARPAADVAARVDLVRQGLADQAQVDQIKKLAQATGVTPDQLRQSLAAVGAKQIKDLSRQDAESLIAKLEWRDAQKQAKSRF